MISERRFTYNGEREKMGINPLVPYYNVLVTKVLKGKDKINTLLKTSSLLPDFFKTVIHVQAGIGCSTELTQGRKYLITGRVYDGKIQINHCDWKIEWHHMSKQMKRGISGEYDCGCHIATCIDGYCDRPSACELQYTFNQAVDDCQTKHRSCQKFGGQCKWISKFDEYTNCAAFNVPA